MKTASTFSASRRPTIIGVMKWPSMKVITANSAGASSPAPMVGKATRPTTISTANIATGPMIGMKFKVAASAPSPAGLGIPVTAQIRR